MAPFHGVRRTDTPSVKLHRKTQPWCALKLSDFSVGHGRPNPKDANSDGLFS